VPAVTKPSPPGVAVRSRKRHAFLVDQREWDYGARLPRDRQAESWSIPNGSESTETPQWGSPADTGSLEPIPEAVAWAERADAWAQQPAAEQDGQWEQPVSRWSDVVPTGRPGYPADGVGWRTETAEWRATDQTARWRQTTEWRSTSGTHGWRSTTEAWQTGSGADGFLPQADPSTRQQLAISGTAWQTPATDDPPDGTPPETSAPSSGTPWQQYPGGAPAGESRPAWQQFTGPPPAPWEQTAARPWEPPAPRPAEPSSWQQLVEPGRSTPAEPWSTTIDGRHLVREDDRAQWRESAAGVAGADDGTRPIGRRRAGDPGNRNTSAGTGWTTRSDADNWAGHTDTGSMPLLEPPPVADAGGWGDRSEPPGDGSEVGAWADRVGSPDRPAWQSAVDETPGWQRGASDPPGRRRDDDQPGRQNPAESTSSWPRGPVDTSSWQRGPADTSNWQSGPVDTSSWQSAPADPPTRPGTADSSRGQSASDTASWESRADLSGRQSSRSEAPGRQRDDRPSWQQDDERPGWQQHDDRPGRQRGDGMPPRDRTGELGRRSWSDRADMTDRSRGAEVAGARDLGTAGRPRDDAHGWRGTADAQPGTADAQREDRREWRGGEDSTGPPRAGGSRRRDEDGPRGGSRRRDDHGPGAGSRRWDEDESRSGNIAGRRNGTVPDRDDDVPSWRRDLERRPLELESGPWSGGPADARSREPRGWAGRAAGTDFGDADSSGRRRGAGRPPAIEGGRPADGPGWERTDAAFGPRGDDQDRLRDATDRWRRAESGDDWLDRSDSWRGEPDSGSWSRGEEPRTDGRRRRTDSGSWRRDGDGYRRETGPATDPWGQGTADTGMIPMSFQPPGTDTGSWRSAPDGPHPSGTGRRRAGEDTGTVGRRRAIESGRPPMPPDAPVSPELWRGAEPGPRTDTNWPDERPPDDWRRELREQALRESPDFSDAPTEIRQRIDPGSWQREERERAERGNAAYREGNTADWRRELAVESDLAEGESRRFGTQDFVPFRPVGTAPVVPPPASAPPASAPPAGPAPMSAPPFGPRPASALPDGPRAMSAPVNGAGRPELLIGNDRPAGARWQDPPDTQWPPRGATNGYRGGAFGGSYERRAVGSLDGSPGRSNNLLEPDEDEIEENTGGPLAAVGYTIIWYGVPVVLFVLYMLVLNGSQQAHALSTLAGAAPQFALSLVLSMIVAVGLRWASGSWKAASVGLAAAVMGGGLATVLSSAISGNALT
jgi:hypothetical protein